MLRIVHDFIHRQYSWKFFTIVLFVIVGAQSTSIAQEITIPPDLVVSRETKPELPAIERNFTLATLSVGTIQQVFAAPPCLTGKYYMGFQLYYDLGDTQTQQNWTADLSITLLNGATVLWTKPLGVKMVDQTFIATVFHDVAVLCDVNYKIRIDAKTLSTSPAPPQNNIYLKILLHKYLDEVFSPAAALTLNCANCTATSEKSTLSWDYIDPLQALGILAYDLEWVFIESREGFSGTVQQAFQFKEPVRITTAIKNYSHTRYYPTGNLYYRVRAVGYNPLYPDHRIPGAWFYSSAAASITNHQPTINWQEQVIFAEDGKYKKIMTYFDGSLRDRQSQTNLSTSGDTTIVAESLYDFEGRKAVDILAVPAGSISLKYKPAFNPFLATDATVTAKTSANRKKFHYDNNLLVNSTIATTSGAGMYYSASNTLNAFRKSYIPNASGYVYSQTEFANDGTGRVKRQAGVGSEFRMDGTGRQTKYFYGNATPPELIRLFGSNVGNANHYKKNLVVDPNGQASVSYLDQEGRTIATALAGATPANVNLLASNIPSGAVLVDLSTKNVKKDGLSTLTQKILNTGVNTTYTFAYNFSSLASLLTDFGCKECKYDLKITITNPDGMLVLLPTIAGNQAADLYSYERKGVMLTDCAVRTTGVDISFPVTFINLGDYTITKTVTPQELTFDEAKTIITSTASVQAKILGIQNSYTVDASNCAVCTSCPEGDAAITTAMNEIVDRDCENIYQLIVQELRDQQPNNPDYVPSDTEIQAHAKYCQYQLCLSTKSSDLYEKQLTRVTGWTDGVSKGYTALSTNPGLDPFFQSGALGNPYLSSMQSKLNTVYTGTVAYDLPVSGVYDNIQDGTKDFKGTLLQAVEPTTAAFYIDAHGNATNSNTIGYHLLYYDLMSRRAAIGEAAYQKELNVQRWTFFKTFYLEAKRKTKLEIPNFQNCAEAKNQLLFASLLPTTEEEVKQYGDDNGATVPISATETQAIYFSFKLNCSNMKITSADSLTITTALKSYFDSKPPSLFRFILTADVSTNSNLIAIQTMLTKYGCGSLTTFAVADPLSCVTSKTVTYQNKFVPQTGGGGAVQFYSGALATPTDATQSSLARQRVSSTDPIQAEMLKQQEKYLEELQHKMLNEMMTKAEHVSVKSKSSNMTLLAAPLPSLAEYNALIAFYNATGGPGWTNKTGWSTANPSVVQDVSGWFGVTVDASGHVTMLRVNSNNLVGVIPPDLQNLTYLTILTLNGNKLTGGIPTGLGSLLQLTQLDLANNLMTGSIPSQIGQLTNLVILSLSINQLDGVFPSTFVNLINLEQLYIGVNKFAGFPPGNLPKLKYLDFSGNQAPITIPTSIGSYPSLILLALQSSQISGTIPNEIGSLTNLTQLILESNSLTGPLPSTLGNLKALVFLSASRNQLSGTLPKEIGSLNKLSSLYLGYNQLTGPLPIEWGELSNLVEFDVSQNQLTGSVPREFRRMRSLKTVNFYVSGLSGALPRELSELTNLESINLTASQFSGDLFMPLAGSLPKLKTVAFGMNNFTFTDFLRLQSRFTGTTFVYSSQYMVDATKTILATAGNSRTLTTNIDRSTNPPSNFQWFQYVNGTSDIALNVSSPSGHTFTLPNVSSTDTGKKYYYKITNSAAPLLTLTSRMQTLTVLGNFTKSLTICTKYDSLNTTMAKWTFRVDAAAWAKVVQQCMDSAAAENKVLIQYATDKLIEDEATNFFTQQRTNCLGNLNEKLTFSFDSREHHYTLYYYDQAANLVQTVAPEGVKPLTPAQVTAFLAGTKTEPGHGFVTRYQSNSLNQSIWQQTPDAGVSLFYYNSKGQLKLSQNAQQAKDRNFSYTKFDYQGRIIEVGEMNAPAGIGSMIDEIDDITFPVNTAMRTLSDITRTYYDLPNAAIQATFPQTYLRNRVAYVEVLDKGVIATDITATYYSYDIHGNVKSLLQQITGLPNKRTDYRYDLVSGNVNYVFYQYGNTDQFIHRYLYDADNRLTDVLTSTDGYIWDKEAKYRYFLHGLLARVELGQYRVQGLDYYYTLQGWVKGVNMPYAADPGNDGNAGTNLRVGRDLFAYTLGYFENDYKPANAAVVLSDTRDQLWQRSKDVMGTTSTSLFNGNISWMTTDLKKIGQQKAARVKGMQAMVYRYDQLNRIIMSRSLTVYAAATGFATRFMGGVDAPYDEDFSYDANGNIKTLKRRGDTPAVVDNFTYTNYTGTNKLRYYKIMENMIYNGVIPTTDKVYQNVTIGGAATVPAGQNVIVRAIDNIDIDLGFTMSGSGKSLRAYVLPDTEGVFNYDAIGNLIWDQDLGVRITWTLYGKVRQVTKEDGTVTTFRYDGAGSRIEKKTVKAGVTTITRYVYDASDNVMGVYEGATGITLTEQSIYGGRRLGMYRGGRLKGTRKLGTKSFELSNHLGNVLSVITDNIRMTVDSTWATVVSANDYYAFGSSMVGRNFNDNTYRYGFNGQEKSDDVKKDLYSATFWEYDSRLGRRWNLDPKPNPFTSRYACFSNNPLMFTDIKGDTTEYYSMANNASLGTINDKGSYRRVKIDESLFNSYSEAYQDVDLDVQANANRLTTELNTTASQTEKIYGGFKNFIAFETSISMQFTGSMVPTGNIASKASIKANKAQDQYADGQLVTYSEFDDGTTMQISSLPARSGPWGYSSIPNGDYLASKMTEQMEAGMVRDGVGFKVWISDNVELNRTALRIHPDQEPSIGSAGCIGLVCGADDLNAFRKIVRRFFDGPMPIQRTFNVNVNVTNNPNYRNNNGSTFRGGE